MPDTALRGDPPPTKTVIVYKNGDAFFPGRKIVVNPRHLSTFDNFLTSLTRGVEAPHAVRKLYTPREGHRVQHLDDLKHGSVYVAAGNEQFKKLDRLVVSARWKRTTDESCTINVFTNGEVLVGPARIRIPKYTLRSWENVLAMVTEKVRLRTGAVYRLCTLDGRPVCGPTELENNQYYVAVGTEKFKAVPYGHCDRFRDLIRENNVTEGQDTLPAIRKTGLPKRVFAHTGFREDLEHTARGQMKKQAKPERSKQRRQVSRNPVLFSTGEGSVFNAQNKRSEMAGAAEVQEERQLKVDLPIDQVEAKTVDEEYKDGSCSASPCKASLHDSDSLCLPRSPSAASRKNRVYQRRPSRQGVTGTVCSAASGDTGLKTPEIRACLRWGKLAPGPPNKLQARGHSRESGMDGEGRGLLWICVPRCSETMWMRSRT
ncbi:doublecortin domain-containing protein 2 isoform X3 [Cottoperca gobio]|uniref:Doublecortin domain-containing protein 2 isoform X3 n=1 Tax=Cottoperca gobio TaxID=56716 RepID=A0A6J2S456_COTGO|nr:doublecortin domain-containing protein 2C isoform X3 [Cottoperca gobio]